MNKQYRHTWRKNHAGKLRQDRFISAYVRATSPNLYREALEFHDTLRRKYPCKMDLSRLSEFQQLRPKRSMDHFGNHASGSSSFQDNLELRIPLLSLTTPDKDTVHDTATTSVPESNVATTVHDTSVPESNVATTVHDTLMPELNLLDVTPLDMSDNTLKDLIEELQNEPQLSTFFDDLDFSDMLMDIDIPDRSPLEQEVLN